MADHLDEDIEIEDNSCTPAPVIELPVTPRRKRSVPYWERVEDVKIKNVVDRSVVSAISIPLSPKKLSSSKEQEETKNDVQEQAKTTIEIGFPNECKNKNYLFRSISSLKPIEIIFKGIKLMFFLVLFALA